MEYSKSQILYSKGKKQGKIYKDMKVAKSKYITITVDNFYDISHKLDDIPGSQELVHIIINDLSGVVQLMTCISAP